MDAPVSGGTPAAEQADVERGRKRIPPAADVEPGGFSWQNGGG